MEFVATGFGDPSVLRIVPTDEVAPTTGEVAIDVRGAGVNRVDYGIDVRMNARLRLTALAQASQLIVEVAKHFTFAEVDAPIHCLNRSHRRQLTSDLTKPSIHD
jgi:hypothetical protein